MQIGIDLGGTKTEGIVLLDGEMVLRERYASPRSYQASVSAIADWVEATENRLGGTGSVGLGIPGALSPQHGRVKNANPQWLIGHDLKGDLEARLNRKVRIANDADCFTLSEAMDGAAAGFNSVFGVIIGTGCGGGFFINGGLVQGPNAISGEWGHNPLPYRSDDDGPARICYCGRTDCIETFVSGPGLSKTFEQSTGEWCSAEDLAARRDQPQVRETLWRYCSQLARSLAGVINIVDPDCIVIGGGVSNLPDLYDPSFKEEIERSVFSDYCSTSIRKAHHGDSSGVRGAAWLWPA